MLRNVILYFLVIFLFSVQALAQEKPELVVSSGHTDNINCLDFSQDGKYIASGGSDNIVKVYNLNMQQELNTLVGFTNRVVKVKFSPNDKYIVSSCFGGDIFIHSHPEGKLVSKIENDLDTEHFQLTSDGNVYIAGKEDVFAYSIETGELVKTYNLFERFEEFYILSDNQTLVWLRENEQGEDGLGFYSLTDKKLIDFIKIDNNDLKVNFQFTPDEKKVIFHDYKKYSIFDIESKKIENTLEISGTSKVLIGPDSKTVVSTGHDNTVRFWNLNNGKLLKKVEDLSPEGERLSMASLIYGLAFTNDSKKLAFGYTDIIDDKSYYTVEWFNPKTMKSIGKFRGNPKFTQSFAVDPSNNLMILGSLSNPRGVKCYDLKKCSQKAFFPGVGMFGYGGGNLAVMSISDEDKISLDIHRAPALRKIKSFDLNSGVNAITVSPSGKYVAVTEIEMIPNKNKTQPKAQSTTRVWDIDNGKEIINKKNSHQGLAVSHLFNEDKLELIVMKNDNIIETIDLSSGDKIQEITLSSPFFYPATVFSLDDETLLGATQNGFSSVNIKTNKEKNNLIEIEEFDFFMAHAGAISPDKSLYAVSGDVGWNTNTEDRFYVLVYDLQTKELVCKLKDLTDLVYVATFDENNMLYTVEKNGRVVIWDIDDCKAKSSFLSFGFEDYIFTTPDGYYKSTKGNIKNVAFRQRGELYTFDQFDLRFNRPDKVLESVGFSSDRQIKMYHKAYLKRLKRMGFSEDILSLEIDAPEVEIKNIEDLPLNTESSKITFSVNGIDSNFPLERLLVTVNDVPIYGRNGLSLKADDKKTFYRDVDIPLVSGKNVIQISVMNTAGIESLKKTYTIECNKPKKKPDLYIIAVGISKYQDSSMNLTYSDKDAEDLVQIFNEKGANDIYNKTHVQLFTNENAVKENIIAAKSKLKKSHPDDHVILFYSGHGVLDEELDYYLSTHDLKFEQPNLRGLNFDDFKDLIDDVPARNRLIFVDACHSGEVDKDEVELPSNDIAQSDQDRTLSSKGFSAKGKKIIGLGNTFELMQELFVELRKESGATIIASSAGKEYSLESPVWKNGVFTFAIKEGLIDKMADQNKDLNISVSELKSYLHDRVQELTDGKQTPTVRRENLQMDYRIY
ncbi:MAG: caspase family protein [Brumimicrobium sp.]